MCYYKVLLYAAALYAAAFVTACRHRAQADSASVQTDSAVGQTDSAVMQADSAVAQTVSSFDIRIYAVGNSGYGYAVYQGERRLIDQPNIPGVPGRSPFRSREEARRTAQLVNLKLQAGLFPPAVSMQELDSLQVHYQ